MPWNPSRASRHFRRNCEPWGITFGRRAELNFVIQRVNNVVEHFLIGAAWIKSPQDCRHSHMLRRMLSPHGAVYNVEL